MLVIGPGSCMLPAWVARTVLMTSTLLVAESKASRVERSGEIVIRPGELPAPISDALAKVSISPSMITRPGNAAGLETLCEARTRVVRVGEEPPQATRLKLATASTARKRAAFFKRRAPNYRKTRDLGAK